MSTPEGKSKRRRDNVTKLNKRLRKEMRTTPWKDMWDFEAVGRGLLSVLNLKDSQSKQKNLDSLEMISVWNARSHAMEALPHAVEATAALAQVYWRDQIQQIDCGRMFVSVTELRLAYSSAIVRCINGFADALQQQRFVTAPVSILCGQLGIPSWLVDIRHEASHNALPTLPVLRLATVTLLEYLQNEYWIPSCPQWAAESTTCSNEENEKVALQEEKPPKMPIDFLLEYKVSASKSLAIAPAEENPLPAAKNEDQKSFSGLTKQSTAMPTPTLPFDTFFGDSDGVDSDEEEEWEDPLLGSIWGSVIGTSYNRFSALDLPKKVKPSSSNSDKPPKAKKPKPPQRKKQPGEKYPLDHAKEFVEVVSPQDGFSTAIQFLVWGGIGGAPPGRGVLIPGAPLAFPATRYGIRKSWGRYLPLIEVLGRVWPGFCTALLVHLVDFVLTIEANCVKQGCEDPGSARKLFFLSWWIRLLVSEQFVQKLYPEPKSSVNSISKDKGKKGDKTEIRLANYESMQALQYPLNSLCDRCIIDGHPELHKPSRDILAMFQEILSSKRVVCHGIEITKLATMTAASPQLNYPPEKPVGQPGHIQSLNRGKLSLDEMEALLSDKDEGSHDDTLPSDSRPTGPATNVETIEGPIVVTSRHEQFPAPSRPSAWTRCTAWDACALGTMPGLPV